jgi:ATP-dependent helicase/nuclease subunit B
LHSTLENFGQLYAIGALPEDAATIFSEILDAKFKDEQKDPDFAAFAWPRLQAAAAFYLDFESRRRPKLSKIDVENKSTIPIMLSDGTVFTLTATADRIEHHGGGRVSLIDYKTGTPPSVSEVRVGFAPQLTLEAAMAKRGAFGLMQGTEVDEAMYVKLFSRDGGAERPLIFKNPSEPLAEISEKHFNELVALLNQFRDPATGYPARPYPKFAASYNAYDHLARVKEWAASREDDA